MLLSFMLRENIRLLRNEQKKADQDAHYYMTILFNLYIIIQEPAIKKS